MEVSELIKNAKAIRDEVFYEWENVEMELNYNKDGVYFSYDGHQKKMLIANKLKRAAKKYGCKYDRSFRYEHNRTDFSIVCKPKE